MRTVILFTLLAATAACSSQAAAPDGERPPAVPVDIARVTATDAADRYEAGGVVRARTSATIMSRILAPVRERRVSAGDRVRAGQVLVVLDARDLTASARAADAMARGARQGASAALSDLRAAESALELAAASHGRIAALHARASATAQELDEARAALRAAESRVAGARARADQAGDAVAQSAAGRDAASATASFSVLTAPFDGLITETLVDPGSMAAPGTPLLRMEDARAFRLEVQVDESRVRHVAQGAAVAVVLEAPAAGTAVEGRVDEIARAVDADSRAFIVKIALPANGAIRSGTFGRAIFDGAPRRALRVPESAIVRHGQVTSVFVADAGVARLRMVSVRGGEVLAGLAEGETVIVSPPPGLTDGRAVTVRSR